MVEKLVDSTVGHVMMSFMDAYSGFHEMPLAEEDQEKTAFITNKGFYCYKVMLFGLQNALVTFQRVVKTVFAPQLGRNMESYIDDLLVKSKK